MYKLRQTWQMYFPNPKLYALDMRVNMMDPAWPIIAEPPEQGNIHVNPRFLVQVNDNSQLQLMTDFILFLTSSSFFIYLFFLSCSSHNKSLGNCIFRLVQSSGYILSAYVSVQCVSCLSSLIICKLLNWVFCFLFISILGWVFFVCFFLQFSYEQF